LVAAILGSAMTFIDGTAVNVALPVMQRELHADATQLQWVVEGYTLFLASLILLGGALGDRFGRRRMFALGIAIFALASLGCALAPTIAMVNVARAFQGAGAALAMPESLALISATYTGDARGGAIGTWSGFASITSALGPLLGGYLAQHASWRDVFLINLPLALVVLVLCWRVVPESSDPNAPPRPDVLGALLGTGCLGLLTLAMVQAQSDSSDVRVWWLLLGALALGVAFVLAERREPHPIVSLRVFRSRAFSGANLYTLFLYMALGGGLYFIPFLLINADHYTPTAAGAALLPFIILNFSLARWSGGLIGRIGARLPLVVGAVIAAAGFVAFALPGLGASYWQGYFGATILLGLGAACFIAPLTTTVFNTAPADESGLASGINNAVARIAGLIAIAGFGIVLVRVSPGAAGLGAGDPGAYLTGFRAVMATSVAVCLLAAIVAVVTIPGRLPQAPAPVDATARASR
jgi:EmrB/QacA subfamily drug resistance transporter